MKKVIALLLSVVMMFAMVSVVAYAVDGTDTAVVADSDSGHGNTESDDQYESAYTVMNLFQDLFERINLLIEYIVTVFFPSINTAS